MASAGKHPQWSSKFGFLMASIGLAVGLGNIWRFPYVTGENGGAAFVLVYLCCTLLIGAPILIAELLIGRRGGMSPPFSMARVAQSEGSSPRWKAVGWVNLLAALVIEIVYCVVAGWVLFYLFKAVMTGFAGYDAELAINQFDTLLSDPGTMLFWTWLGLMITGSLIYIGVQKGIERAVRILMPLLFLLLVILVIVNMFGSGFSTAIDYLFRPDFSKINSGVFLAAIGQAFYSIGVATAGMMTFGAYLPRNISITQSVFIIVIADTIVAMLAGLVIFPVVFGYGLDPQGGAGLIFQALPVAFSQMPGGHLFGVLFFLLLSVATITSMVGPIESCTAYIEELKGYSRHKSTLMVLMFVGTFSVLSILSYSVFDQWRVAGKDLNQLADYFSNQILLPLGGLLIAVFTGWFMSRESLKDELNVKNKTLFNCWHFLIRYPVPVVVLTIFIFGVTD